MPNLRPKRQIANFESDDDKLVQIVFVGPNNLCNKLKRALLSLRAAAAATLDLLTPEETADMISFRLTVAGWHEPLFTPDAHELGCRFSRTYLNGYL